MKLLFVGVVLLVSAAIVAGEVGTKSKEEIKSIQVNCAKNFQVSEEEKLTYRKIKKGEPLPPLSQNAKCFLGCALKGVGMINGDNKPVSENLTWPTFATLVEGKEEKWRKCAAAVTGKDECEVAGGMYKCLEI